jgi:predicted nuclease with TOPRIM domain
MVATAEARTEKRRINELEQKLKKLQRELRELKVEKKQVGNLRKQAARAIQVEADCTEIIEEVEIQQKELETKIKKDDPKSKYRCKNIECIQAGGCYQNTGECAIIDAGVRFVVICKDCGSRYSVVKGASSP